MPNKQQALSLTLETLSDIFNDSKSTTSILRKCYTISSLLDREKDMDWIKAELEGYKGVKCTIAELEKVVPDYRKVRIAYTDSFGRPIYVPTNFSMVQNFIIEESIVEIENKDSLENGFTYTSGGGIDVLREIFRNKGISLAYGQVPGLSLSNIVTRVRNKALDFLNAINVEQPLGNNDVDKSLKIINEPTENARLLLFSLENSLRKFVSQNISALNGEIGESMTRDWTSAKRKEFMPPRKPIETELINYSTFDQLKKIIIQSNNWEKIFRRYFGRPDGVISRLNELDDLRDTIAHNRVLSDFDYNSFKTLYGQIVGCIEPKKV
jgi:hypothetical protein